MPEPLVIAYHLMWTAYGFWLPNDPRGSTSHEVADKNIAELGELHYGRRRIQPTGRAIREFQEQASEVLKFSLLKLDRAETNEIAAAFSEIINQHKYTCYACAIMPDHVHILIRKHKHLAEEMIGFLQDASRLRLRNTNYRPGNHPVWGGDGWKVFLYHPDEIHRTMRYIENNPIQWKLPRQNWSFVVKYDNWPLHPGYNPNSPYAKGLRNYYPH